MQLSEKLACTMRCRTVQVSDLPLSCPPKDERVWDAHPRVYLPLSEAREVLCPYCGTRYQLI